MKAVAEPVTVDPEIAVVDGRLVDDVDVVSGHEGLAAARQGRDRNRRLTGTCS
jgi:hypothetical protein